MSSFFPSENEARHRLLTMGIDVDSSYLRLMVDLAGAKAVDVISRQQRLLEQAAACSALDRPRLACELFDEGIPVARIAEAMGVARFSVYRWLDGCV